MNKISTQLRIKLPFPKALLTLILWFIFGVNSYSLPIGGNVTGGAANISGGTGNMTINQTSGNVAINWQSFSIGKGESVQFVQPNSNSVALNRVMGSEPSSIYGKLTANGKVFLVNPNGILFGLGSQINVEGLVASTLNITDSDLMSSNYHFSGAGNGSIVNQGTISTIGGGFVALLGDSILNKGYITARLGSVLLAAGTVITLDMNGDGLLNVAVNKGAVNALVQNGGLIQADGGLVLMTTQTPGSLLPNAVNNTGILQAQTIDNHSGTIKLLAGMQNGIVNVGGTITAEGGTINGDGGFIETSASHVVIANGAKIDTLALHGNTGLWLLDPVNYNIATTGGDETPASVTASLASSNRLITASNDITVSNTFSIASPQILTLNAGHDVLINASISAVPAGAGLILIAGNNVNVAAALTVTGAGSSINISATNNVLISAPINSVGAASPITINTGLDVTSNASITTIGAGSAISMSAGRSININSALTATAAGSSVSLLSGLASTGPGVNSGTVTLSPTASVASISTIIRFNPQTYANTNGETSAYLPKVTGTLDAKAWVFTQGTNKIYDGTNAATLTFIGNPADGGVVTLNPGSATFDSQDAGSNKVITFRGTTLNGVDANKFALFSTTGTTTANITPVALIVTAANATKTYGQTITLTGFSVAGLVGGDTIGAFSESSPGTVASASVAGSPYAITLGIASGGSFKALNYSIVYVDGKLTITPQPLVAMTSSMLSQAKSMLSQSEVISTSFDELLSVNPIDVPPIVINSETPSI